MRSQYRGRVDSQDTRRADTRRAIGTWLSGPREAAEQMGVDLGYRGERLGLPESGPGAVAPPGRRIAAIVVDWALCLLVSFSLLSGRNQQTVGNWAVLVFFLLSALTVGTVGCTPGKLLLRLRVIGEGGSRLGFWRAVLRSLLLVVVIPAVIWDRDGRGLHDRLARAVQIRV
ncbi:RDD family protein [Streptomyces sp. B1866]|uniref:RDD family protein n=1 Tax=Streptomyces sp. B1866 TaxID=3075431 RepID=UPI00289271DB|nr:RDD family protein [Streptomyces sp. B1866]MDT3396519.1 RDD family protein [Streptomyces sp. B1866]